MRWDLLPCFSNECDRYRASRSCCHGAGRGRRGVVCCCYSGGAIRLREDRRKLPLFGSPVLVYFVDVIQVHWTSNNLNGRKGQLVEMGMDASWVFHTCTGWPMSLMKTSSWLSSDSSGSWWAAKVATYCPDRMTELPKPKSTGGFHQRHGSPCRIAWSALSGDCQTVIPVIH